MAKPTGKSKNQTGGKGGKRSSGWSEGKWGAIGLVAAACVTIFYNNKVNLLEDKIERLTTQVQVTEKREAELAALQPAYDATEELYRVLPSDCDYIIRNLVITKQVGSDVAAFGPGADQRFSVTLSSMLPETIGPNGRTNYIAKLDLAAVDGSNRITPRGSGQNIKIFKGQTVSNISALNYEFYLHVDSVDVDSFTISLARRMNTNSTLKGVTAVFGALQDNSESKDIPAAIIPRK